MIAVQDSVGGAAADGDVADDDLQCSIMTIWCYELEIHSAEISKLSSDDQSQWITLKLPIHVWLLANNMSYFVISQLDIT